MDLGVIEGFYGPLWSAAERRSVVARLAQAGYGFYHYAPKMDPCVRTAWRQPWSDGDAEALTGLAASCRALGMRFGIGLTPLDASAPLSERERADFAARLEQLNAIGIDELVLAFDDLRDEAPKLAARQAELVHWAAARSQANRIVVCPTYYSEDPLLDRLFGERPSHYLTDLGAALDSGIGVYWTGPKVCSPRITHTDIAPIAETLQRRPILWDNYPVNDGPRMSPHLHLRAFTERDPALAELINGHAINPALQPSLSCVPALTLAECYGQGAQYDAASAWQNAADTVLGSALRDQVAHDLTTLHDEGRAALSKAQISALRRTYMGFLHPAAAEIVAWLDGAYAAQAIPTDA
jgi:hypothetical protein